VPRLKLALVAAVSAIALFAVISPASAETIAQALAAAYSDNPQINSARAQTRADDENVPIARGGYTPIVSLFSDTTANQNELSARRSVCRSRRISSPVSA
jgi:outer membrane protein